MQVWECYILHKICSYCARLENRSQNHTCQCKSSAISCYSLGFNLCIFWNNWFFKHPVPDGSYMEGRKNKMKTNKQQWKLCMFLEVHVFILSIWVHSFFLLDWYKGYLVRHKGSEVRSHYSLLYDAIFKGSVDEVRLLFRMSYSILITEASNFPPQPLKILKATCNLRLCQVPCMQVSYCIEKNLTNP